MIYYIYILILQLTKRDTRAANDTNLYESQVTAGYIYIYVPKTEGIIMQSLSITQHKISKKWENPHWTPHTCIQRHTPLLLRKHITLTTLCMQSLVLFTILNRDCMQKRVNPLAVGSGYITTTHSQKGYIWSCLKMQSICFVCVSDHYALLQSIRSLSQLLNLANHRHQWKHPPAYFSPFETVQGIYSNSVMQSPLNVEYYSNPL